MPEGCGAAQHACTIQGRGLCAGGRKGRGGGERVKRNLCKGVLGEWWTGGMSALYKGEDFMQVGGGVEGEGGKGRGVRICKDK